MNIKTKKSRDGMSYKKTKKVKKDTLYYVTQKIIGEITDIPLAEQNDDFLLEYKRVKDLKKLIIKAYPFEELKDIKKSSTYLYDLINLVYNNYNFKRILKKVKSEKENSLELLDIHQKREYFKSIEYILGEEYLEKHPAYRDFKDIMELLDRVEDIQQSVEYDFDIIEYIDNNTNNIKKVREYLDEYKDTMLSALNDLRRTMQLDLLSIKGKENKVTKEDVEEECIIYKYNEVEHELQKNINIVNEKKILIDCMGKGYSEIKKEGYLTNLPIDEVIYVNMKIDFK